MKIIESLQNKKIKELAKLHTKKERDRSSLFLVEGEHMVMEAQSAGVLTEVFLLIDAQNPTNVEATYCSQSVLNKLSSQNSNAIMIGLCKKLEIQTVKENKILLLNEVQDPGNVGTLIRTAYSFGYDAVYVSKGCADVYNEKTLQSSQGAIFHLPVIVCDMVNVIQTKKESMEIYATALHHDSISLQEAKPKGNFGIVLGNEGQGLPESIINICTHCLKIEMDRFESLNVAVAGSICMYTLKMA